MVSERGWPTYSILYLVFKSSMLTLPCHFPCLCFFGQRPQQGSKSCRMGRNSIPPSICLYVHLSPLWLALRPCRLAPRPCWLALRPLQLALRPLGSRANQRTEVRMGGCMNGQMDGISPHSTGLCPLLGPLPCYFLRLPKSKIQGKGTS